jgi:hypothetical protein
VIGRDHADRVITGGLNDVMGQYLAPDRFHFFTKLPSSGALLIPDHPMAMFRHFFVNIALCVQRVTASTVLCNSHCSSASVDQGIPQIPAMAAPPVAFKTFKQNVKDDSPVHSAAVMSSVPRTGSPSGLSQNDSVGQIDLFNFSEQIIKIFNF